MPKKTNRRFALFAICGPVAFTLSACSSANIVYDHAVFAGPEQRPAIIYVSDFDLQSDVVKSEGLFSHGPMHMFREQSKAQSLVDQMGDAIVDDLQKQGLQAKRVTANASLPQQGWLVRGVFLQVDDGNRLRRAVIGFGEGQTDLQVAVAVDDLSTAKSPLPLYQMGTDAESGKSPGAVVMLNPYVAAAKFVLSGLDLNRNTAQSASKIADDIVGHVKSAPLSITARRDTTTP